MSTLCLDWREECRGRLAGPYFSYYDARPYEGDNSRAVTVRIPTQAGLARVLELVFPSKCVHCDAEGSLLCGVCLSEAAFLKGNGNGGFCRRCARNTGGPDLCHACAESPPPLSRLIAVYQFDGAIRDAVHALKYNDIRALGPILGRLMSDDPRIVRLVPDAIVPVPLHARRERSRGYNQAALLARPIAELLEAPVAGDLLRRTVHNQPQVESRAESARSRNVSGIFKASPGVRDKRILLVDDVATTGSTLRECARTLLKAGARRVDAVVLAKEI